MIRLCVLTNKGIYLEEDVLSFVVPALNGPLQINEGHTPYIASCLDVGVMKIVSGGKTRYFVLFGGILHVKQGRAVLLAEDIENAEDIDLARAEARRDAHQKAIAEQTSIDLKREKASLAKQLARIAAKLKSEGGK